MNKFELIAALAPLAADDIVFMQPWPDGMDEPGAGDLYDTGVLVLAKGKHMVAVVHPTGELTYRGGGHARLADAAEFRRPRPANAKPMTKAGLLTALTNLRGDCRVLLCSRLNPEDEIKQGQNLYQLSQTGWPLGEGFVALICDLDTDDNSPVEDGRHRTLVLLH